MNYCLPESAHPDMRLYADNINTTPEQIRAKLDRDGISLAQHCRNNGISYRHAVLVLNGFTKGRYGKAHVAAVKLGLKVAA